MFEKFQPFLSLMRIDRPVGSLLLLWPTLIALKYASEAFSGALFSKPAEGAAVAAECPALKKPKIGWGLS